eukprot:gene5032-7022_t
MNQTLTNPFENEEDYKQKLLKSLMSSNFNCHGAVVDFRSNVLFSIVTAIVFLEKRQSENNSEESELSKYSVEIWRYVNSVPLIDYEDDAMSCCVISTIRKCGWKKIGLRFTINSSCSTSEQKSYQWHLQSVMRQGNEVREIAPLDIIIIVDILGHSIPFANTRKTSIAQENKELTTLIKTGTNNCIKKLQLDETLGLYFMNKLENETQQMIDKYIPSVAASISKMVVLSQDSEFQSWCLANLHLNENDLNCISITRALRDTILDVYEKDLQLKLT